MKQPILITGTPRSGKSIVAGVMEICGVFGGEVDHMNENKAILSEFLVPYLLANRIHPKGLRGLVDVENLPVVPCREKVEELLLMDGYEDHQKWYFKSSSICLTWPMWRQAFPQAKVIIVRRSREDIINSCIETAWTNVNSTRLDWVDMLDHYENCLVEMLEAGMDCRVVWPEEMARGNYSRLYELLEWLELPWKSEILTKVDPKFWKMRKKKVLC